MLAALACLTLLAGCSGGGDDGYVSEKELPRLVLLPADLTQEWAQFDEGRQARADTPTGARADPARFGRLQGWKSRYRRGGSAETAGPLVLESRVDLFGGEDGAAEELAAVVDELEAQAAPETLELGDEARAFETGGRAGELATVLVVWRDRNVVATLSANGFSSKLRVADVVEVARKQQARIAAAG